MKFHERSPKFNTQVQQQHTIAHHRMGKRFSRGPDGAAASRKRQKVVHEAPTSEEIHATRQLQQLLSFSQDPVRARHGALILQSIGPCFFLCLWYYQVVADI
jgi:hypothetical protein